MDRNIVVLYTNKVNLAFTHRISVYIKTKFQTEGHCFYDFSMNDHYVGAKIKIRVRGM